MSAVLILAETMERVKAYLIAIHVLVLLDTLGNSVKLISVNLIRVCMTGHAVRLKADIHALARMGSMELIATLI